jgi:hypothetical protein
MDISVPVEALYSLIPWKRGCTCIALTRLSIYTALSQDFVEGLGIIHSYIHKPLHPFQPFKDVLGRSYSLVSEIPSAAAVLL